MLAAKSGGAATCLARRLCPGERGQRRVRAPGLAGALSARGRGSLSWRRMAYDAPMRRLFLVSSLAVVACGDDGMNPSTGTEGTTSAGPTSTSASTGGASTDEPTGSTSGGPTSTGPMTSAGPTTDTDTDTDTGGDGQAFRCLYPPESPGFELPSGVVDTAYPAVTGQTIHVAAGGDLQAALDGAALGDEITLEAGATFTGNFVLGAKQGSGWIVVRTDGAGLPGEHTRVGLDDAAHMPTIETAQPLAVLSTQGPAHHFRFVGIQFRPAAGVDVNDLIVLGDGGTSDPTTLAHDLVFDRCIVRGDPTVGGKRGIQLNATHVGVVDSYFTDWKRVGQDTQALLGWNTPGNFRIVNNHLEAAGENMMFGGADAAIPDVIPSDIEICGNTFTKPLRWKVDDPSYEGTHWSVKNLFELKVGRRVLVSGNRFEQCWPDAQTGFAIVLKSANQDGGQPWAVTEHVSFVYNAIRGSASGISVSRTDGGSLGTNHVQVVGNLLTDIGAPAWGGDGRALQLLDGVAALEVAHNTGFGTNQAIIFDGMPLASTNIRDNIFGPTMYGVFGSGHGEGSSALDYYTPGGAFAGNVVVGASEASYPAGNFFPASVGEVGFVDPMAGDYGLTPGSTFAGKATDGGDPGALMDLLAKAAAGEG